jgi:hypothetical protein
MVRPSHGVGIARHALRAAVSPLGHQLRAFQHGHVLLHGGKRHLVSRGQFADRCVGVHHTRQNVAPRGIGQGPEQLVQVVGRSLATYNHMVVYSSTLRSMGNKAGLRAEDPTTGRLGSHIALLTLISQDAHPALTTRAARTTMLWGHAGPVVVVTI